MPTQHKPGIDRRRELTRIASRQADVTRLLMLLAIRGMLADTSAAVPRPHQIGSTLTSAARKPRDGLTAREKEVLGLLAASLSDSQIADHLVLSKRTVHAHVRAIYSKLNVTNRSAATRYAIEHGLI